MATWKIGKLVVRSGGESSDGDTSRRLKKGLEFYSYGPAPDGRWPVDPKNDWTIHRWATERADRDGVKLTTDYADVDEDMPKQVRKYLDGLKYQPKDKGMVN